MPVTHMGYSNLPVDAFLSNLETKDLLSVKEWEHVNAAGVCLEPGLAAMQVMKEGEEGSGIHLDHHLKLDANPFKAALKVMNMRAQYFRVVTEQGVEIARQMSLLVEQGHDPVFSNSYRTSHEAITSKLEIKAGKKLGKSRLERARGQNPSEGSPCGAAEEK